MLRFFLLYGGIRMLRGATAMFPGGASYRKCVPCRRLTQALVCPACGTPTSPARAYNVATSLDAGAQFGLSPRESEVMGIVAEGASNAEVGRRLGIADNTVKVVLMRARRKMGARTRMEAARMWWEADG